jgi:hypothetical protein
MKKIITILLVIICSIGYANNDKYRIILTDDPATTMTIGWNQINGNTPIVYYGSTDQGTSYQLYPNSQGVDRVVDSRGMDNSFVRLTGLSPNTNYYFVIHDSNSTSQRLWFRTAPDDLSRLSFIAGGDSRNNSGPRQDANLLVSKLKPHAVLFGGDMTNNDEDDEWKAWFDDWQLTTASDGRMIPIVPTVGNHEGSTVIYELFDTSTPETYYALTFGDNLIRSYTLNTNISVAGNQLTWLDNDLSNSDDVRWRTVQYHKPMRPHTTSKSEGDAHYDAWANLFYDKGVRLVTDSDSHLVKTTYPVQPASGNGSDEGFKINNTNGTIYAGEGCWGAPLRTANDSKDWTRDMGSFNQFKLIFIDNDKIELRTIRIDNASSVGEVTNTDPFTLPANLNVWNPSNGSLVTINYAPIPTKPSVVFNDGELGDYANGSNLSFEIDVLNNGGDITSIEFYVDGSLVSTDTTSPYGFTHTYSNNSHTIEARAYNANDQSASATMRINVGSFTNNGSVFIANGNDDVEEGESTGSVSFNSSDLEFFDDGGWQIIGLRFQKIDIPVGATINSASIRFKSDATDSQNNMNMNISIEDTADALPFDDNNKDNVSGRMAYGSTVTWDVDSWSSGERGSDTTTDDLSDLLQGIVNRCDWSQGNDVVFMFNRTGANANEPNTERKARTYDDDPGDAAELRFSFTYDATIPNPTITKFENGAWTNGLPTSDMMAIIIDDYNTAEDGSFETCYLSVHPTKSLTISAGDYVQVNGDFTLEGSLTIANQGSFVQLDPDAKVINNGTIEVNLTTPNLKPRDFILLGSPMTEDIPTGVNNPIFRKIKHHTVGFRPHPDVQAAFPGGTNFVDEDFNDWSQQTTNFNPGEAYLVWPQISLQDGNQQYDITYNKGTLNSGEITYALDYNTTGTGTGTAADNKNASPSLLSNPYPSAISAVAFLNANDAIDELYFWEHNSTPNISFPGGNSANFNMADISTFNDMGFNPSSTGIVTPFNGSISTGQGFGIKNNGATTGTGQSAVFNNTMRVTGNNNTLRSPEDKDRIWLSVASNDYELQSTALVGFIENATRDLDTRFDSKRVGVPVSLYSHLTDGSEALGIQGREAFTTDIEILLGFSTQIDKIDALYTISIDNIDGGLITEATVYLKDNYTDVITNLSETDYTFSSSKGTFDVRFTLLFENEAVLNTSDIALEDVAIFPNPTTTSFQIASPNSMIHSVQIIDILGRTVQSVVVENKNNTAINVSSLQSGNYLIKIETEDGMLVKQLIKN